MLDPRFDTSNPLFKKNRNKQTKVKVDERFQSVLTDDRFLAAPGQVDKYGRKKKDSTKASAKELSEFYQISDDAIEGGTDGAKIQKKYPISSNSNRANNAKDSTEEDRLDYLTKLSRGEIDDALSEVESLEAYDHDEDGIDEEVGSVEQEDFDAGNGLGPFQVDNPDEIEIGSTTHRIALQNCDWDSLKAEDIMVVLQSFCPTGKSVISVTVYLSDYGREQLEIESRYGVQGIWKQKEKYTPNIAYENEDDDCDNVEDAIGSTVEPGIDLSGDFVRKPGQVGIVMHDELVRRGLAKSNGEHSESSIDGSIACRKHGKSDNSKTSDVNEVALRRYELNRLRYYFAIAICDSVLTAEALYAELDGLELEHSAMTFDLRFVPVDVSFANREVRDSCKAGSLVLEKYTPPDFVVQALQHTSVECSWDAGEKRRERVLTNLSQWRQLNESDLQQYIASSDSSDEEGEDNVVPGQCKRQGSVGLDESSETHTNRKLSEKAARMRKLLLGDDTEFDECDDSDENGLEMRDSGADDGDIDNRNSGGLGNVHISNESDDDLDGDNINGDDFFVDSEFQSVLPMPSNPEKQANPKSKRNVVKSVPVNKNLSVPDGEMTMTYIPDDAETKDDNMTPFEALRQKLTEKRRKRKQDKKERLRNLEASTTLITSRGKGKTAASSHRETNKISELETMQPDDDEEQGEFNMRSIAKEEKLREKLIPGKKNKKLRRELQKVVELNKRTGEEFRLNLADPRFAAALLGSDPRFGIDTTSPLFKPTSGMKTILEEQRQRKRDIDMDRHRETKPEIPLIESLKDTSGKMLEVSSLFHQQSDQHNKLSSAKFLVNKLKRKFESKTE